MRRYPVDHVLVRKWITTVLLRRAHVVALALRQRAKFEGWLKFELAAMAEEEGASDVNVEASSENLDVAGRADVSFIYERRRWDIELKTPNTNFRMPGVRIAGRPITQNINAVIADARKLARSADRGIVAFILFPVPVGDDRWHVYLARMASALGLDLTPGRNANQLTLSIDARQTADVVVGSFSTEGLAAGGARPSRSHRVSALANKPLQRAALPRRR